MSCNIVIVVSLSREFCLLRFLASCLFIIIYPLLVFFAFLFCFVLVSCFCLWSWFDPKVKRIPKIHSAYIWYILYTVFTSENFRVVPLVINLRYLS